MTLDDFLAEHKRELNLAVNISTVIIEGLAESFNLTRNPHGESNEQLLDRISDAIKARQPK